MKQIRARLAKVLLIGLAAVGWGTARVEGSELSVADLTLSPGATGDLVVSGVVAGEITFGYTVLVEIIPRAGNAGTVTFTAAPPTDIIQSGDPWPSVGTFTAFDTDSAGFSTTLNGAVDDDGRFLCDTTVNYSGPLVNFPVIASSDADGIWDVVLSTSAGDGTWECQTSTLIPGTITVSQVPECQVDTDCDDLVACTDDTCPSGSCVFTPNDANCTDDGLFCSGAEICDATQDCISTGDPCQSGEICDETSDACVQCLTAADCDDANVCTDEVCNSGACEYTDNTVACDDGQFCTLTDVCSGGTCVGSEDPCTANEICDEATDACVPPPASLTADDVVLAAGDTGELLVSGDIAGDATFGVTILVEIVSRPGNVGAVTFSLSPPVDIVQRGDPWPGAGIFTTFDTDSAGFSDTLNGSVDDNGSFLPAALTYSGPLTGFPIVASADAGGVWDVVLATTGGDSGWESVPTGLNAGTISVPPSTRLTVSSRAMPPGSTVDAVVSGAVDGVTTSSVDILLEIVPRPGNTGTLQFTAASDITSLGNPWGANGTFSAFDSTAPGFSQTLNGSVHGTFSATQIFFDAALTAFPVVASADADGVWDLLLVTSAGTSGWDGVPTVLEDGAITVSATACVTDSDCDDSNTCTQDVCTAGICGYTTLTGSCDDGDLCTINDTCQGDTCLGTPLDCSSLDDACNTGTCNATSGVCEPVPTNEGGLCDDGDLCTQGDVCGVGTCAGTPIDCSSLDDTCNVGTCNATSGLCEPTPTNEGGGCDDADVCTENDVCSSGTCTGTAIDCSQLDTFCTQGVCDSASGSCMTVNRNQGFSCNDNNPCTTSDRCSSGVCTGTPKNCSGQTDACNIGTCNVSTGSCEAVPANEGATCDDGDPCTDGDSCENGVCTASAIPGCVNCVFDSDCNDGNVCTTDACVGGACQNTNTTDACNDGDPCTISDACSGGACVGVPKNCTAFDDVCTVGVCNSGSGNCEPQPANEGGTCDDGYACTINDVCTNGACVGTLTDPPAVHLSWSPSSDTVGVGETVTFGLVASSGTCVDQPVGGIDAILDWDPEYLSLVRRIRPSPNLWLSSGFPNDSALDGLNADCGADTFCDPYTSLPYNDGDALYQALRDFQRGVNVPPSGIVVVTFEFEALKGTHGSPLAIAPSSGQYTGSRVLGAGPNLGEDITGDLGSATLTITNCQNNAECDDGNVCTTDTCNGGVCEYVDNALACDDGLFCTDVDLCSNGSCVGSSDPCVTPLLCDEDLDACVECLGDADCNDGNICTDDVCDASGSCNNPSNAISCDDGLFCTAVDQCSGGTCTGGGDACPGQVCDEPNNRCVECLSDADCDDNNVCTTDSCNLSQNTCEHANNSLSCDDGQFCTVTDTCSNGTCTGSGDPCSAPLICSETLDSCVECELDGDCDDGNPCTTDTCFFNTCSNSNNLAPCDDGLFCTTADTCSGGQCVGTGDRCPGQLCDESNQVCVDCFTVSDCADDGVACTVDACVDGSCVYPPDDTFCDDGLFCNGPEFCHATLDCQPGDSPCDDPQLCDEATDACGCQEPVVVGEGCRYLAVTPRPGQTPVALRVTGVNQSVACVALYVQADGRLGPTPVFKTPGGLDGWQTAHVRGIEIIPDTSYAVETECDTGPGVGRSTAAMATTWKWADTDNSGGLIDLRDIILIINGFSQVFTNATLYNVDLWGGTPEACRPQLQIDLFDIVSALHAFAQVPFTCSDPCP